MPAPGGRVLIQPISLDWVQALHRCLDEVSRERRWLAFLKAPPLESTRRFVEAQLKRNAPMVVATEGGEVVGWCDIQPGALEGFTHCGRLGMGVRASHRRGGIGSKLLAAVLEKGRNDGLTRVELDVYASNTAAIALYEKAGFVIEGRKKNARLLDGEYDDLIMMAKML